METDHFSSHTQAQVTRHYDERPPVSLDRRGDSQIIHMKNFNNWVKSVLIASQRGNSREFAVLDICCGKGGDMPKWTSSRISYLVALDISQKSVEEAKRRYEGKGAPFPALFLTADCFSVKLEELLKRDTFFDMASCQFALHYSFENEARARKLLENVSTRLKVGGTFVGTIPNSNWIVKKLRSAPDLSFGNEYYTITFARKDQFPRFGAQYTFRLCDAVDNIPEYLVHFPTLEKLAGEVGLRLVGRWPFHEFYEKHIADPANSNLFCKMRVIDKDNPSLSDQEWEICGIYLAFVFKKDCAWP